jgi:large subunit ribosomal protein L29
MKPNITKGLDVAELQRQAYDAQEQLFRLRFQMGMGQSEGLKKYRTLKKDRARLLTVLREKQIAGETIPPPIVAPKPAPAAKSKKK